MSVYCDVALPVPLDRMFTYVVGEVTPAVGARVLVPFGGQRLMGVVVRVHDAAPGEGVEVKPVQTVMDDRPLLDEGMLRLGSWVAEYYCAPLGEVLRGMLPLSAEVKRQWMYRIGEAGRRVLYDGAAKGSSRRSRLTPEEQDREYKVLNYLEDGEAAKVGALRSATGAGRRLLEGMVKKKWLTREAVAEERDARRVVKIAVVSGQGSGVSDLGKRLPKLNENQVAVMAELAAVGGRLAVRDLRVRLGRVGVPESSLGTLVKRGLVGIEEEAEGFWFGFVPGAAPATAGPSASLRDDKKKEIGGA